jgi:hypothetical protein
MHFYQIISYEKLNEEKLSYLIKNVAILNRGICFDIDIDGDVDDDDGDDDVDFDVEDDGDIDGDDVDFDVDEKPVSSL